MKTKYWRFFHQLNLDFSYLSSSLSFYSMSLNTFMMSLITLHRIGFLSSLYAWFGFMLQSKKRPKSFLTIIPNGRVRHFGLHPLQAHMKKILFEWEYFPIPMQGFLPHGDIGIMDSGGILLAVAEVFTSRKRNYTTPS